MSRGRARRAGGDAPHSFFFNALEDTHTLSSQRNATPRSHLYRDARWAVDEQRVRTAPLPSHKAKPSAVIPFQACRGRSTLKNKE